MADSIRQQKYSRLIQRDLGEIFQRSARELFGGRMVSVTIVRMSPDLGYAKVYLSVFPPKDADEVLQRVRKKAGEVRYQLGQRIRQQARVVPELSFFIDDSLDYAERIDELLR